MNILEKGLKKVIKNVKYENSSNAKTESEMFTDFHYHFKNVKSNKTESTLGTIPKFYNNIPEEEFDEQSLNVLFQFEARTMFLQKLGDSLLDTEELEYLKALLDQNSFKNEVGDKVVTYQTLMEVMSTVSPKCKGYYNARLIAQLQKKNVLNEINIVTLFTYAMRKTWSKRTRMGLSVYDTLGRGFLREGELESFIADLIPECPHLCELKQDFYPFYVCTVVRKFMFFLDPMRTGRIRLIDIMESTFLDDLLVLRNEGVDHSQETNWFSASSALRVYGQYLALDRNRNGLLSKSELAALGMGTFTSVFVDRVFQEYLTYNGEMDYKAYLDFVLALENKQEPQALRYFFRIFDIDKKGYLDAFCLNYFFRSIQDELMKRDQENVKFEDIKDELFDMVRPVDSCKITYKDLLNCEQADYFVSILTDLNEFWNYENREYN